MVVVAIDGCIGHRRRQDQLARHRRVDEGRHLQPLRRQFGADCGGRQQRVAEALFHQADLGAVGIGLDHRIERQPLAGDRLLQQRPQAVRNAGQDQLLLHQPLQVDLLAFVQPRSRRPDHDDVLAPDRSDLQMQVGRGAVDDREIHLGAVQPFDQVPAIALDDAQRDIGEFGDDAAGEPSGEHRADGRHQAEDDAARRLALGRLQVVADLLDLADQPGGAVEQHPAGAGQQHAAAVAHEQFDAQLVFEQLDVPAQRRLCGSQAVCRLAEAAELGHGPERAQLLEVHDSLGSNVCLIDFERRDYAERRGYLKRSLPPHHRPFYCNG